MKRRQVMDTDVYKRQGKGGFAVLPVRHSFPPVLGMGQKRRITEVVKGAAYFLKKWQDGNCSACHQWLQMQKDQMRL